MVDAPIAESVLAAYFSMPEVVEALTVEPVPEPSTSEAENAPQPGRVILRVKNGKDLITCAPSVGGDPSYHISMIDEKLHGAKSCRRVTWTLVKLPVNDSIEGYKMLAKWFNVETNKFPLLVSVVAPGTCIGVIYKPVDKIFEANEGWTFHTINKPSGRDTASIASFIQTLLRCSHKTTMVFEDGGSTGESGRDISCRVSHSVVCRAFSSCVVKHGFSSCVAPCALGLTQRVAEPLGR